LCLWIIFSRMLLPLHITALVLPAASASAAVALFAYPYTSIPPLQVSHILLPADKKELLAELKSRVEGGEPLAALAAEHSTCPSRGWVFPGRQGCVGLAGWGVGQAGAGSDGCS